MHDGVVQDLVEAWAALLARHTTAPEAAAVGRRLLASWSEPHRRYHAVSHLRDILSYVDELAEYADDASTPFGWRPGTTMRCMTVCPATRNAALGVRATNSRSSGCCPTWSMRSRGWF